MAINKRDPFLSALTGSSLFKARLPAFAIYGEKLLRRLMQSKIQCTGSRRCDLGSDLEYDLRMAVRATVDTTRSHAGAGGASITSEMLQLPAPNGVGGYPPSDPDAVHQQSRPPGGGARNDQ
jgi:hypothetical protein